MLGAAAAAVLALSLASCSALLPGSEPGTGRDGSIVPTPETPVGEATELIDTRWAGVDSDGDEWDLHFQQDGTIGLGLNGDSFDDASDTWRLTGGTLTVVVSFDDGVATMTGDYRGLSQPIELGGSFDGEFEWELTLRQS